MGPCKNLLLLRSVGRCLHRQKASICHKSRMDPLIESQRPLPYDYTKKRYTILDWTFNTDSTMERFTENTAIITVDGPPGCGKTHFAKRLADELGMKHFEEPNMDVEFVDDYNYDLRFLNRFLFRNAQFTDTDMIVADPTHPRAGSCQQDMLKIRFWFYMNYMTHLFSTGDGLVIERVHGLMWSSTKHCTKQVLSQKTVSKGVCQALELTNP